MLRFFYYICIISSLCLPLMYCSPNDQFSDHGERHPAPPTRLDLSGTWEFTPIHCLPSETECIRKLAELPVSERTFQIDLPDNLRRHFPWFTGDALLARTFELPADMSSDRQMQLLIGGIGSLDRVFINGEEVGDSGYSLAPNSDARFHSTWSKVRYYSVHHSILQKQNRIEIHFVTLDVKAGVYRGPIILGTTNELYSLYWWLAFLFEYIYQAETILAFFIFFFFLIYTLAPPIERGFRYMTAAFAAYAFHSLYFIPLPIELDYLSFLKLQWVARILSQQWIIISMLLLVRLSNRRIKHFVHVIAGVLILVTFAAPSYSIYFSIATWIQFAFQLEILYFLGVYLLQHRERGDRSMIKVVLTVNLIVTLAYISDLLLRLYVFNTPWVYHYIALLNMLQFMGLYSYKMYAYQAEARIAKHQLLNERLRISMELHDVLGANLGEIIIHSESMPGESTSESDTQKLVTIRHLARRSLRYVRDLVSLLKWEEQNAQPLRMYIQSHLERLRKTGRYEINHQLEDYRDVLNFTNLQLQRIYSEWMTNVLRHSRPQNIRVRLRVDSKRIVLLIVDDGNGLSWRGQTIGSGLTHISDRVKSLHGRVRSMRFSAGEIFFCSVPVHIPHPIER